MRNGNAPIIRKSAPPEVRNVGCKGHYLMMKRGTLGYGKEPVRGADGRWATKR
jgi:hypothetical protein